MKSKKIGIVGCGNIGSALAKPLVKVDSLKLSLFDTDAKKVKSLASSLGASEAEDVSSLARESEIVVISVKPQVVPIVLAEIAASGASPIVVSLAAGVSLVEMEDAVGDAELGLVRAMPNLAMEYGVGVTGVFSKRPELASEAVELFSLVGMAVALEKEELVAVVTGVAGSG